MPAVLSTMAERSIETAFAETRRRLLQDRTLLQSLLAYLSRNKSMALSTALVTAVFTYAMKDKPKELKSQTVVSESPKSADTKSENEAQTATKAHVNTAFWVDVTRLIRIAVPGPLTRESAYLLVLASILAIRTFLSIKITGVNGEIVRSIVQRDFQSFLSRLAILASIAIPASMVNSLLKYLRAKLALCFRERLVNYFHDAYFHNNNFFSVLNLDSRIVNPDQALTATIDQWATSLAQLYSDVTKPLLDIALYAWKITDVIGVLGPVSVIGYYFVCGLIINGLSPKFGRLTAETQRLEGSFRSAHNRLMIASEEVAFYGGENREKSIINNKFLAVCANASELFRTNLSFGAIDGFLTKYGAVLLGYSVLGLPVFGPNRESYTQSINADPSQITRDYVRNSGLLINFSQAIGRIVTSYKELQRLSGLTSLVSQLDKVLVDLEHGKYERTMLNSTEIRQGLAPGAGVIAIDESAIAFDDVPIITPNGDLLVDHVTFSVKRGENLMIVGPNGCGKSSLFRILGSLWPLWGGRLTRPSQSHLFYVPQRPFLTSGTLRDQLIYPDNASQMAEKSITDSDLVQLLKDVHLEYLLDRPGGLVAEEEWSDRLSGGEKQRVAMARLFYHRPYFAILDECTSAVSVDVEGFLYTHSKSLNITLITISHRATLWPYHDYLLKFEDVVSEEKRKAKRVVNVYPMATMLEQSQGYANYHNNNAVVTSQSNSATDHASVTSASTDASTTSTSSAQSTAGATVNSNITANSHSSAGTDATTSNNNSTPAATPTPATIPLFTASPPNGAKKSKKRGNNRESS